MFRTLKEIWKSLNDKEKEYLKAGLKLILILGFISIIVLPWALTREFWSFVDYKQTGAIGDTINGIAGPFIALIAAILTFLAFYIQYKANIQQREQFSTALSKEKDRDKEQEKIWRIERFENKFYELLKLHKANVDEMNIGDRVRNRKSFVHMFYELRYCYIVAQDFYNSTSDELKNEYEYDKINLMDFSYRIFFFGIGLHSEKHFIAYLKKGELHLFRQIKPFLEKIQEDYSNFIAQNPLLRYYTHGLPTSQIPNERTIEFFYFPFDGHVNRLGHYYRHLFQTVTFVSAQDFLSPDEKYGYIKILRAQLSNFEQLLLYYNALAWFDSEWRTIFTEYRLIKNLPIPLADFDVKPEKHFEKEILELRKNGIEMFEWNE